MPVYADRVGHTYGMLIYMIGRPPMGWVTARRPPPSGSAVAPEIDSDPEFTAALLAWAQGPPTAEHLQHVVALGAGLDPLPLPPPGAALVGAWPAPVPWPRQAQDRLLVFLACIGHGAPPRSTFGFIRASLASRRILFQIRGPGALEWGRALTELAPLTAFLTGVPMLQVRFVHGSHLTELSLTPTVDQLPLSDEPPWVRPP